MPTTLVTYNKLVIDNILILLYNNKHGRLVIESLSMAFLIESLIMAIVTSVVLLHVLTTLVILKNLCLHFLINTLQVNAENI